MCHGFEAFDLWGSLESDTHRDESGKVHDVTSGSNEATDTTGGRGVSRNLVHSNPIFSFNTQRRSWIERSRAASRDMLAAANKGAVAVSRSQ